MIPLLQKWYLNMKLNPSLGAFLDSQEQNSQTLLDFKVTKTSV